MDVPLFGLAGPFVGQGNRSHRVLGCVLCHGAAGVPGHAVFAVMSLPLTSLPKISTREA